MRMNNKLNVAAYLHLSDVTKLNNDNNIKYIYAISNDNIEIDYKKIIKKEVKKDDRNKYSSKKRMGSHFKLFWIDP